MNITYNNPANSRAANPASAMHGNVCRKRRFRYSEIEFDTLERLTMAQKTYVELIDDIDGQEADETVSFALDGVLYEIDLSKENSEALREELRVYIENARREAAKKIRATVSKAARTSAGVHTAATRERNQQIRRWANTNGIYVSNFGRIPGEAVAAFEKNEETSASKRQHRKNAG